MASDVHTGTEASVTGLVTGIINDAQELFKQQVQLLKHEVKEDIRKTRDAGMILGLGIGVGFVGATLLAFMLAHLLAWAEPAMPLWACYGICGAILFAVGAGICYAGAMKLKTINPLPNESAQILKENVQWMSNPK